MNGHRRSFISSTVATVEHSPLGHLYSRDTSIYQGTQNSAQACKNVSFVTSIYFPIQGKGTLFLSPETWV